MRRLVLLAAVLSLWASSAGAASYVGVFPSASSVYTGQVLVEWYVWTDPTDTVGTGPWYGFDVYRRDMAACGPWVRVTANSVPRAATPYITTEYHLYDTPPPGAWDYHVRLVDASGAEIHPFTNCECATDGYAATPLRTVPVIEGTVASIPGWPGNYVVHPCPGSCYPTLGIDSPLPDGLLPLVDTGTIVSFYAAVGCGIEGCLIPPDWYGPGSCGAVPDRVTSWGHVKSLYR